MTDSIRELLADIRPQCKRTNIAFARVAEWIGVNRDTLYQWCGGSNPRQDRLAALVKAIERLRAAPDFVPRRPRDLRRPRRGRPRKWCKACRAVLEGGPWANPDDTCESCRKDGT